MNARPNDVTQARAKIIDNTRVAKADISSMLEAGHRDWPELRAAVERYIDFQTAADVLGGTTTMEKSK